MISEPHAGPEPTDVDIGAYCRQVEAQLTRENTGHLVRIVGPAFDIVRQWALDGVPLSVVFQGIAQKAERHRAGRSAHPLRIEFCESDVRALFDHWKRAVGVTGSPAHDSESPGNDPESPAEGDARSAKASPSLSKHLDRARARLAAVTGRLDLPDAVRELAATQLGELEQLREHASRARGPARQALVARLEPMHQAAAKVARAAAPSDLLAALTERAEQELGAYRTRLPQDGWRRAVDVTVDRLLREHFGLPTLEL